MALVGLHTISAGLVALVFFGIRFTNVETAAWFGSIAEAPSGALGLATVGCFITYRRTGRGYWLALTTTG